MTTIQSEGEVGVFKPDLQGMRRLELAATVSSPPVFESTVISNQNNRGSL